MPSHYLQGFFKPTCPEKYLGNANNIVCRSSYELAAFRFVDRTPEIVRWSSERTIVPYQMLGDSRVRRYFIDLTVEVAIRGGIAKFLIEVKPKAKMSIPRKGKNEATYMRAMHEYLMNKAKWEAATRYAEQNGSKFIIWTEDDIFGGAAPKIKRTKKGT